MNCDKLIKLSVSLSRSLTTHMMYPPAQGPQSTMRILFTMISLTTLATTIDKFQNSQMRLRLLGYRMHQKPAKESFISIIRILLRKGLSTTSRLFWIHLKSCRYMTLEVVFESKILRCRWVTLLQFHIQIFTCKLPP